MSERYGIFVKRVDWMLHYIEYEMLENAEKARADFDTETVVLKTRRTVTAIGFEAWGSEATIEVRYRERWVCDINVLVGGVCQVTKRTTRSQLKEELEKLPTDTVTKIGLLAMDYVRNCLEKDAA